MSIKAANFVLNSFSLFKIGSNEIDVANNTLDVFRLIICCYVHSNSAMVVSFQLSNGGSSREKQCEYVL